MSSVPLHALVDTWNASGETFDAIKMSVTDTASASGSRLLELLVDSGGGASSKFRVDKAGNVTAAGTLNGLLLGNGPTGITSNVAIGGMANASAGSSNIAIGLNALRYVFGNANVAIGVGALGGASGTASGNTQNTAVGNSAGSGVTTGLNNTFIGQAAGSTVTTGQANLAVGANAAIDSPTGSYQINIGDRYFHDRLELKNATSGLGDCILLREAANSLAMRNGTSAQTLRLYNTYSVEEGVTSYERGYLRWDSDLLLLGTEKAGSGTLRRLTLASFNAMTFSADKYHAAIGRSAGQTALDSLPAMESGATGFVFSGQSYVNNTISHLINFRISDQDPNGSCASIAVWRSTSSRNAHLAFGTNPGSATGAQATERMRITDSGNVGIGTTSPSQRLHLFSTALNGPNLRIETNAEPNETFWGGGIHFQRTNASQGFGIVLDPGNSDSLALTLLKSPFSRLINFMTNGRVGIGTTGPDRRLEVNDSGGNCLRLTYNDTDGSATNFCDLLVSSGGDLTIDPSGGDVIVDGALGVTGAATFSAGIERCGISFDRIAVGSSAKARGALDVAIGFNAGGGTVADVNYTGNTNTCVGSEAGEAITSGWNNVFVGYRAGKEVTTGARNTLIGASLTGISTGRGNVIVGNDLNVDSGTSNWQINIGNRYFHNRIELAPASTSPTQSTADCILLREAANVLAMRNGINAQTFRLYNTYTDASNYERGYLRWDADILKIGTEEAGSGTARALELQTDGVTRVTIPATAGRIFVGDMIVGRGGQTAVVTNTALGALALNSASLTGGLNTAIGYSCLNALTTAIQCTAVGGQALSANTTGTDCVAVGFAALAENTTASSNVAVGSQALRRCTGADNVAIGSTALSLSTTGTGNCALGRSAGFVLSGSNNTLIGRSAGAGFTRGVATLGAITGGSGYTDGSYSGVALTYSSGSRYQNNPTANITVSGGAVTAVTVVSAGTGFQATDTVLTASAANLGGTGSGFSVAVASLTGAAASNNTLIGFQAGDNLTQGSGNIVIGSGVDADSDTGSNQINIGDRFYHDRIRLLERSSDPTKPTEGNTVVWMSDGTGLGDDGDVIIASTAGGVTNYAILFDHSAGTLWS